MTLSDVQQHLFSYFNLAKVTNLESTLKVLIELQPQLSTDKHPEEKLLKEISFINKTIKKYDLEVVESIDEITTEKLFILINTADNFLTKKPKFYHPNTSHFFSKIIKNCILSEKGYVSETFCINLSSEVKMKKTTADSALDELIRDKWLVSENGKISLGMRCIVELEQNIKQLYPDDVRHCPFCKLLVVQGYICGNCKIRCHNACWKKYSSLKPTCVCPNCNNSWSNEVQDSTMEDSLRSEDSYTSTPSSVKRKKRGY